MISDRFPDPERYAWFREHSQAIIKQCRREVQSVPDWQNNPLAVYVPGGDGKYPSFWVRDAVMICRSGLIPLAEMMAMCRLILVMQNQAETRFLANGLRITPWAIADHINLPGLGLAESQPPGAVFFPGTYLSGENQGNGYFGLRPADDNIYEVIMLVRLIVDALPRDAGHRFLMEELHGIGILERLDRGWQAMPVDMTAGLPLNAENDWSASSFHDALRPLGLVALTSVLRARATRDLARLYDCMGDRKRAAEFEAVAKQLGKTIVDTFQRDDGWLMMASKVNRQADLWSTSMAVFEGILPAQAEEAACRALLREVVSGGVIDPDSGYLRHTPTCEDIEPGRRIYEHETEPTDCRTYQYGGYWPQCTGFVCYALNKIDPHAARCLAEIFIDHTRDHVDEGCPVEWLHPVDGIPLNGRLYGPSAALPLCAFTQMMSH